MKYNKAIVYISIFFLLFYLYKNNYLYIPEIYSYNKFFFSFLLLFGGFIAQGFGWYQLLKHSGEKINLRHSLISSFLFIFTKYIPGKIWMILGPAGYINKLTSTPLSKLSIFLVQYQLLNIWSGLILGSLVFSINYKNPIINKIFVLLVIFIVILSFVLFFPITKNIAQRFILICFKRKVEALDCIIFNKIKYVIPFLFLSWFLWACGFSYLADSIFQKDIPWQSGFAFVLAGVIGVLAIISPGGLGIREGCLSLFLIPMGVTPSQTVTLSVVARIWFVIGEAVIFISALFLKRTRSLSDKK